MALIDCFLIGLIGTEYGGLWQHHSLDYDGVTDFLPSLA
jgi:hypothetical protein